MESIDEMIRRFSNDKKKLHFFDANCWIGKSNNLSSVPLSKTNEIIEQMDYYGIERAIVSHTLSMYYHPLVGNKYLLEEINGINKLQGCFVLLPPSTKEMGLLDEYIDNMLSREVRAVRIFPKSHHFSIEDWSSAVLLGKLEERRIPLFIWSRETEWDNLYKICKNYPRLPVILEQPDEETALNGRFLFPLLEKCKNLFLEVHNCILYLEIDEVVKRFGAERLIFGTYLPVDDPNASLMLVTDGDFSQIEKEKIAHKNLEKLIKGVLV